MNRLNILRGFTIFVFFVGVGAFLMAAITYHHTEPAGVVEPIVLYWADPSTGCEYLIAPQGGITPRNNTYGAPGGCRDTADIEGVMVGSVEP